MFDQHTGRIVYVNVAGETWTFDVCTNTWQNMNPEVGPVPPEDLFDGAGQPSGAIISLVYDIDSDVTVAFGYERVSVYDANTNTWTTLPSNSVVGIGPGLIIPTGAAYDPVTGLIITTSDWEFWAYDVDTNEWTLLGPLRLEPSKQGQLDFLGYSEQLDRLIVAGGVDGGRGTILVDPRTGDVTVLPIESPNVDLGWPNGVYGPAANTVYVKLGGEDICGFDTSTLTWSACFDTPAELLSNRHTVLAAVVGDEINQRLILINGVGGDWSVNATDDVWAIDLDTGEWTQLLEPSSQ